MRYSINAAGVELAIESKPGVVMFQGQALMPHEAAMLGEALESCAQSAEDLAFHLSEQLRPVEG